MARGANSDGHWNFHIKRYKCPDCNRKGLHRTRLGWVCMYRNCVSYTNHNLFKKHHDEAVLQANPELSNPQNS